MKVIALYDFSSADDNDLISLKKNDILTLVEDLGDWLRISNKEGHSGLAPVSYLAGPVDDDTKILDRGKLKQGHNATSDGELTLKKDSQVAILDKQDSYWWFVGYAGKTGYIPKSIIKVLKRPREEPPKNKIIAFTPEKALCCAENTRLLCVFEKELPADGKFMAIFKGENCEKTVDMERLNGYALQVGTPRYYPAEKVILNVTHVMPGSPPQKLSQTVAFEFESKLDVVNTVLKNEADPVSLLCSSFQVEHGDAHNVDHLLAGILEKKIPEGFEVFRSNKNPAMKEDHNKEIPNLLHFAVHYNLKRLVKAILKCPGATEALAERNCQGMVPLDMAREQNNQELQSILEDHEDLEEDGNGELYEKMEQIYEEYTKMDDITYVDPNEEGEIYVDMEGDDEPRYLRPRQERGRVEMEEHLEERTAGGYKGRMSDKELQLALLVKRVKERYITHEQALEMAKVLRLEPEVRAPTDRSAVPPRGSGLMMSELSDKLQTLPRTTSTSSGSSVSSASSSGSAGSTGGHTTRLDKRRLPAVPNAAPPIPSRTAGHPPRDPPSPRKQKVPVPVPAPRRR